MSAAHTRRFEPSASMRAVSTLSIGLLWLSFVLIGVGLGGARPSTSWLTIELAALLLATVWPVQEWRGGVVVDEAGIILDSGLGWTRRVRWEEIEGMRYRRFLVPAAIELTNGRKVRFGLSAPAMTRSQFRELAETIESRANRDARHEHAP